MTSDILDESPSAIRARERRRAKRVARDERAERKRAAKNGFSNPANPRRSMTLTLVTGIFALYCL
ncbi:MAG: carbohydrate ABC transporter permease, partial [Bifidobacterium sp.]|nr:carbohydrate ABC transporter permease [Bifidobacterium sp.]